MTEAGGRVVLVGAGPGDPELLTLKAVRVLGEADVVLVDDLVNRALLVHAPRARIVEVGKRGGCRATPQAFIDRCMIREARAGRCVVRLKGGDPFIFGRGGEELARLRSAGIEVEIVSGVTAAVAAAAAMPVPLTHRDHCRGVVFITGHTARGKAAPWVALAAAKLTVVIYMGMARLAELAHELAAAGFAPDVPFAVVQDASLPSQRVVRTTLASAPAAAAGLQSPGIIIVGECAGLVEGRLPVDFAAATARACGSEPALRAAARRRSA